MTDKRDILRAVAAPDRRIHGRESHEEWFYVGNPRTAVDFDASAEGHHTRYDADGKLVGLTILNARLILEEDGKVVVTLPDRRLETSDLGDALAAA